MKDKSTKKVDMIFTHGYLITMNQKRQIIEDGAIAIKDGSIAGIGKTNRILSEYETDDLRDLKGKLLHPGLIDAHNHVTVSLLGGWVPDYFTSKQMYKYLIEPYTENKTVEHEFYSTLLACVEMVLNGTTAFGDTGVTGDENCLDKVVEAVKMVGLRGRISHGIADRHTGSLKKLMNSTTGQCIRKLEYQLDKYPAGPDEMVGCWVGIQGMGTCSDELLVKAKKLADKYNTILHMHQSVFADEVKVYMAQVNGKLPIEHLYELDILGPKTSLVHMIYLNSKEVDILEKTKTRVVHCPGASVRFGLGSSIKGSFPEMIKRGIIVALGTDEGNCSDALDMFKMAYLAATIHKEARCEVPVISIETALEMATINGAIAMGMDDKIGSLEIGKKADIVIHHLNNPESHPNLDPLNNLLLSSLSKSVDTVLVDGKIIVENGKLMTLDTQEIFKKIDFEALNLAKKMGYTVKRTWPII
jgi:5-methylthioadenosine/S-adenosylhomocysteine deaminase